MTEITLRLRWSKLQSALLGGREGMLEGVVVGRLLDSWYVRYPSKETYTFGECGCMHSMRLLFIWPFVEYVVSNNLGDSQVASILQRISLVSDAYVMEGFR